MDFEFIRGDTQVIKFILTDLNRNIISLTSADRIYFTVKNNSYSNDVLIQKTIGNGIELKDDGYYYVTINSDDTSKLEYGQYGYDIELKTGTGIVKTLTIGSITLTEEYTFKGDEV